MLLQERYKKIIEVLFVWFKEGKWKVARVWCNLYRNCGEDGLKPQKIRKYDGNFKVDVVEYMYANHLSLEKTRMHFKLPSVILYLCLNS